MESEDSTAFLNIAKGSESCDLSDQKQDRVSNVISNEGGQIVR